MTSDPLPLIPPTQLNNRAVRSGTWLKGVKLVSLWCVVSAVDPSPAPAPVFIYLFPPTNSFKFHPQMTTAKSGFFFSFSLVTERLIFSRPTLPEVEASERSKQLRGGWEKGPFEVTQTSLAGGRRPTAGRSALPPP